jgi:tetratricopeptide (TPR) repeat protein
VTTTEPSDGPRAGGQTGGGAPDEDAQGARAYDLFQTGRRFLAERHPGQAAMYLERALLLAPDKNSIREALGRSYYALARYESAAPVSEERLRRAPTNDYAHFALSRCLLKLGDVAGALRAARLALAMAPGNADYRQALEDCLAAG